MGQRGFLNLYNATPYTWQRTNVHSYQMNAWDGVFPQTLAPGQQARCHIEFSEGVFENPGDDAGEVNFSLQGTPHSFQIQVRGSPFHLQVDWSGVQGKEGFFMFPPPSGSSNNPSFLGWMDDGTLTVALGYKNIQATQATDPSNQWGSMWMQLYAPVLQNLTVPQLTIPGTHDSGTYDMVSIVGKNWTQCQDLDFTRQLNLGTRSFDMRIGYQSNKSDEQRYILCHEDWRSNVTLANALQQFVAFSNAHPQELIVLDFHRFTSMNEDGIDFTGLIQTIKNQLGGSLLLPSAQQQTLGQIWASTKARIIVAFNNGTTDPSFWPGVNQQWAGSDVTDAEGLQAYISKVLSTSLPGSLWSIQAAVAPKLGPPVLEPNLSNWFYAGTTWAKQANILAVDWVQKTTIPSIGVCASMLKGLER